MIFCCRVVVEIRIGNPLFVHKRIGCNLQEPTGLNLQVAMDFFREAQRRHHSRTISPILPIERRWHVLCGCLSPSGIFISPIGDPMCKSQLKILVVDDERNIRNNLGMLLEAEGHKVDRCSSADEALQRLKDVRYDIAFVDIQMPKMDGLQLLRCVRVVRPKLPVVMLTAYGTVSRAVEAMKLGAADFLEKPFHPKAIQLLCQEILERQKVGTSGTVDELLHLAELARQRKAITEARLHLKVAMMRDVTRPEPYYELGELCENERRVPNAVQYYYMALEAQPNFEPARTALIRLGRISNRPAA
jgi:DNA-binding response OmpR family regulator